MSSEAYSRRLAQRVRLNRQILENKYWFLPVYDKGHENYMPVGRGDVSSDHCGRWVSYHICEDVDAHKGVVKNGVDYTDMMVVRNKHLWCHRSACPICFIRGWSVRQAMFIDARLAVAVERGFGKVEHVIVSPSKEDYDLSESALRVKARKIAVASGVNGYCMIFHGFRIDRKRDVLAWRPHYHILGFVDGGYDRCRRCKGGDCYGCDGIQGRCYRAYQKSGYIVRVLDERQTVYGTCWYQLHHSTIRLGIKRFHVVTWGGRCAHNNFKTGELKPMAEQVCPICEGEMDRVFYVGERRFAKNVGDVDYKAWFAVHVSEIDDFIDAVGSRVSKEYG